jgi:RNA polymerase sigma factor (TIGR02999 family)
MHVSDVTRILDRVRQGEAKAAEELLPVVYEELRRLAHQKMAWLPPGQTLQATALVHEAYLRLVGSPTERWQNSRHFFAAAAEAMRHILIDRARGKMSGRRGGHSPRVDLDQVDVAVESDDQTLLLVDEALDRLSALHPTAAAFVKLRYFVGLRHQEIAELMGLSERSSKRLWTFARAWLFKEIAREL